MSKSCNYGGGWCPKLATEDGGGFCQDHAKKRTANRGELQRFYSTEHRKLRIQCFERDGWACVRCGWKPRVVSEWERFPEQLTFPPRAVILAELTGSYLMGKQHLQAHHIEGVDTHPELAEVLGNMATLCRDCHALDTANRRA